MSGRALALPNVCGWTLREPPPPLTRAWPGRRLTSAAAATTERRGKGVPGVPRRRQSCVRQPQFRIFWESVAKKRRGNAEWSPSLPAFQPLPTMQRVTLVRLHFSLAAANFSLSNCYANLKIDRRVNFNFLTFSLLKPVSWTAVMLAINLISCVVILKKNPSFSTQRSFFLFSPLFSEIDEERHN